MELAEEPRSGLDVSAEAARLNVKIVRVQVLAARQGGVFFGPYVPDTRGTGRFPAAVRLRATLLGVPLGELTLANEHGCGRVLDLTIGSSWLARAVALSLVQEAARLAPQAAWESLCWELQPRDAAARALARSLGFRPVSADSDERRFERPLQQSAW